MIPAPLAHHFMIDGESYTLMEYTRGGEARIHRDFALHLSFLAGIPEATMRSVDGNNLYVEAVARECLKEAPSSWWEEIPNAAADHNGHVPRRVTFEHVRLHVWTVFCQEVNTFLEHIFRVATPAPTPTVPERPADSDAMAAAQPFSAHHRFVAK